MAQPNSFILIVDSDGDPREVLSANISLEEVQRLCTYYAQADGFDENGPYTAWRYDGNQSFQLVPTRARDLQDGSIQHVDLFSLVDNSASIMPQ